MKSTIDKEQTLARIDEMVKNNPVVIFMKGDPTFPMCGYSARAVEVLRDSGCPFVHCNVLTHPDIFAVLPDYADWNTFPQIYAHGQLIGGCDIVVQLHERGELASTLSANDGRSRE